MRTVQILVVDWSPGDCVPNEHLAYSDSCPVTMLLNNRHDFDRDHCHTSFEVEAEDATVIVHRAINARGARWALENYGPNLDALFLVGLLSEYREIREYGDCSQAITLTQHARAAFPDLQIFPMSSQPWMNAEMIKAGATRPFRRLDSGRRLIENLRELSLL